MAHLKYHMGKWKARRYASKLQIIGTLTVLAATLFVILFHLGSDITWTINTWIKLAILIVAGFLYLFSSLSAFSNYSFLFRYYESKWIEFESPDVLELTTGNIIEVETLYIPYAGHFKRITFQPISGKRQIYYMKKEKFRSIDQSSPIRLKVYHMFAVRLFNEQVESVAG